MSCGPPGDSGFRNSWHQVSLCSRVLLLSARGPLPCSLAGWLWQLLLSLLSAQPPEGTVLCPRATPGKPSPASDSLAVVVAQACPCPWWGGQGLLGFVRSPSPKYRGVRTGWPSERAVYMQWMLVACHPWPQPHGDHVGERGQGTACVVASRPRGWQAQSQLTLQWRVMEGYLQMQRQVCLK